MFNAPKEKEREASEEGDEDDSKSEGATLSSKKEQTALNRSRANSDDSGATIPLLQLIQQLLRSV